MATCALLLVLASAAVAAPIGLPLCGSANGFAGELNYEFSLVPNVEVAWGRGEAVVIAVRPIPFNPADPTARAQAFIDARYSVGNESFRYTSGPDGLLALVDRIPMGTAVDITVRNARLDGPTPFVLYTYVSNRPHCFLDISPRKAFLGPVPGSSTGSPPSLFFATAPPSGAGAAGGASSALRFSVTSGVPVSVFYAASSDDMAAGRAQSMPMGIEVMWPRATPAYIEVRPAFAGPRPVMLRAVVEWRLIDGPDDRDAYGNGGGWVGGNANPHGNANGNTNNGGGYYPPPQRPVGGDANPPRGTLPPATKPQPPAVSGAAGVAARAAKAFGYLILFAVAYFMIGSVYNYSARHIRSFPEYVPHYEALGAALAMVGAAARTVRNKASRSRGGYSGVNSAENEDA